MVFRALLVSIAGLLAAQKYFLSMIRCIFRAPMSFFDSTPAGRILNRVCEILELISMAIELVRDVTSSTYVSSMMYCTVNFVNVLRL